MSENYKMKGDLNEFKAEFKSIRVNRNDSIGSPMKSPVKFPEILNPYSLPEQSKTPPGVISPSKKLMSTFQKDLIKNLTPSPSSSPSKGKNILYTITQRSNPQPVLPNYTEISSSPSIAAGVPVLELIRKMEDEKILTREDRVVMNDALYKPGERRDKIITAIRDVELGSNSRFAIRRLKALIHQNGSGMPSSQISKINDNMEKRVLALLDSNDMIGTDETNDNYIPLSFEAMKQHDKRFINKNSLYEVLSPLDPSKKPTPTPRSQLMQSRKNTSHADNSIASMSTTAVTATIRNVVGNAPLYSGPEMFNVCTKISKQLGNFMTKYQGNKNITNRKFAVIVGTGSCNPITRMHMRTFFLAKQHLEQQQGFIVLGSLLSPAHPSSVRERYRNNITEVIPAPHRLAIAQLLVQESKWLSVDPWEITRKRSMDYLASLEHTAEMLKEKIPNIEIKVIYLCKGNMIPKISPQALKAGNFGCVVVSRAPESDQLLASLSSKWNGLIWVCEDTAILDTSLDIVSGRSIRKYIKKGHPVSHLIGDTVETYINENRIGPKMQGEEPWGDDEKKLPKFGIRPVYNPLRLVSRGLNSISSNYSNNPIASNLPSVYEDSTLIDDNVSDMSP